MPGLDDALRALYYNKNQAVNALGIKPDRFDDWVTEGLITPVKIQGYKRPYYAKADIDTFAKHQLEYITEIAKQRSQGG
jgi:hypothetical protein